MNKKLSILSALLVAAVARTASAQCASNIAMTVSNTQSFGAIAGSPAIGTDVLAKFWHTQTPANSSGTKLSSAIVAYSSGKLNIASNWNGATNGACPLPLDNTVQTSFLVSIRVSEGTAAHKGQYSLATYNYSTTSTKFIVDRVSNGSAASSAPLCNAAYLNCVAVPLDIPVPVIQTVGSGATYNHAAGTGLIRVTLNFGADAAGSGRYGYYATVSGGAQPASQLITGFKLYQITGASAPTTSTVASWGTALVPSGGVSCTGTSCTGLFPVNAISGSNSGYFAAQLEFAGGAFTTDFVSGNSAAVAGPLAVQGLPTSVEIYPTKVSNLPGFQARWTSTNENEVASYKVVASVDGANWVTVQDNIATKGAGTYTQNITRRTLIAKAGVAQSYMLKVVVVKRDGTTQDTSVATYVLPTRRGE